MASVTPNERKRLRVISSSVRPAISTSAFGRSFVNGRRRVPSPAASTMAFIGVHSFTERLQAKVPQPDLHTPPRAQPLGQLLGKVDRAVLPAGASERHHQIL